jgi:YgiT-type zinc finger domain-containing protein
MKCVICKMGHVEPGKNATMMLNRDDSIVIIKNVPASICDNCGEEYFDSDTTGRVLELAEDMHKTGVEVSIRSFVAA